MDLMSSNSFSYYLIICSCRKDVIVTSSVLSCELAKVIHDSSFIFAFSELYICSCLKCKVCTFGRLFVLFFF